MVLVAGCPWLLLCGMSNNSESGLSLHNDGKFSRLHLQTDMGPMPCSGRSAPMALLQGQAASRQVPGIDEAVFGAPADRICLSALSLVQLTPCAIKENAQRMAL